MLRKVAKLMAALVVAAAIVVLGFSLDLHAASAISAQRIVACVGFVVLAAVSVAVAHYDYRKVSRPHRF